MTISRHQSKTLPPAPPVGEPSSPADQALASPQKALHLVTFGCQMNKYDSERVEGRFRKAGYALTGDIGAADVVLFNTCSVRDHAEERVWSWLGDLKRQKSARPDLVVGVMGCMAQRLEREIFQRAQHVDLVVGTRAFQHLPEMVETVLGERTKARHERAQPLSLVGMDENPDGDREGEPYTGGPIGYLAIMRGCDLNCTFCIVPNVRGRVLSRSIDELEREARWMVERGAKVLVLLGQTVNSYGEDLPAPEHGSKGRGRQGRPSLADLLYRLQAIEGLVRIRLITLHPAYVTRELAIALAENDKCERFLPLPVQSGSDAVLRAMKRGYTLDLYRNKLALLRQYLPDLELATDWIVGFPGETDADFEASEEFLSEAGFAVNYIFKYSPRPGTRADLLPDDVSEDDKKSRNLRLLERAQRVQRERLAAQLGNVQHVFLEEVSDKSPARAKGKTRQGLLFVVDCGTAEKAQAMLGTLVEAVVEQASAFGLSGRLAQDVEPAGASHV